MKTLYLVRHAKSDRGHEELADIDRPLNQRGYRDAHTMSARFRDQSGMPDCICASPAIRALSTALIFCRNIGFPASRLGIEERIYEASVETLMNLVAETDDRHSSLMLFGHNPAITHLANTFAGAGIDNVPTCGIVAIRFEVFAWMNTRAGGGACISFDFPKKR
ncbi:MAG: histidine phosphatase family protein [Bacteroidota bacterium]